MKRIKLVEWNDTEMSQRHRVIIQGENLTSSEAVELAMNGHNQPEKFPDGEPFVQDYTDEDGVLLSSTIDLE